MNRIPGSLLLAAWLTVPGIVLAEGEDKIFLEETVISGNQELPKVLYILPWRERRGEPVPATGPPRDLTMLIAPVYPDEQRRALAYRATAKRTDHAVIATDAENSRPIQPKEH